MFPALAGRFFTTEPPGKPLPLNCMFQDSLWLWCGKESLGLLRETCHWPGEWKGGSGEDSGYILEVEPTAVVG